MTRVQPSASSAERANENDARFLDAAIESWRDQLEKRNDDEPLAHPLELSAAHPTGLAQLLAVRPTRLSSLVREPSALSHSRMRARELVAAIATMQRDHGIAPLFFSFGEVKFVAANVDAQVAAAASTENNAEAADPKSLPSESLTTDPAGTEALSTDSLDDVATPAASEPKTDAAVHTQTTEAASTTAHVGVTEAGSAAFAHHRAEADTATADTENSASGENAARMRLFEGPAFLVPARLIQLDDGDYMVTLSHSVNLWGPLRRSLVQLAGEEAVVAVENAARNDRSFSITRALTALHELGSEFLVGFDLYEALTLGQYLHPADLIADDIDALRSRIERSDLVRALAGDKQASERVYRALAPANPLDRDPDKELGIGDLEPAHDDLLEAVTSGRSVTVGAGPDSNLVMTVSALAVNAAINKQAVVFVSSDSAKTRGVAQTLQTYQLDDMLMDLTDPANWSQEIADSLQRSCVVTDNTEEPAENQEIRDELRRVREVLGSYTSELHQSRSPWGISAFDALQVLADLSANEGPRTRVRFSQEYLNLISEDGAQTARAVIKEAYAEGLIAANGRENPWNGAVISGDDVVEQVIETVQRISRKTLPQLRANVSRVARETGLMQARTLADWDEQLQLLAQIAQSLQVFRPIIFERSVADLVIATAPRKWRKQNAYNMKRGQQRRLLQQAEDFLKPDAHPQDLHHELQLVQQRRALWRNYTDGGSGWPVLPSGLPEMQQVAASLATDIKAISPFLETYHGDLRQMPIDKLAQLMDALADDEEGARALPGRVAVMRKVRHLGLSDLIEDLRERGVSQEHADAELDLAWWASALAVILDEAPILRDNDAASLNALTAQLRALDLRQVASLAQRAGFAYSRQVNELVQDNIDQAMELLQYLQLRTPKSLAALTDNFPLVRHLAPIKMAAAALIPQLYSERATIDLAIIDIARGVTLAELIPVIARSRQVVFLHENANSADPLVRKVRSVFPQLQLPVRLTRRNELIAAFLNEHGVSAGAGALPSPRVNAGIELFVVDGRATPRPGAAVVESSDAEVARVVDLAIAHAYRFPEQSLAIVALNERHALHIREAMISAAVEDQTLSEFLTRGGAEPLLISAVQCLTPVRRDRLILSIGYAKTPHGRIIHDFGDISAPGGLELLGRALNVARGDVELVSAIEPSLIDRSRLRSEGATALVDLLELARSGGEQMSLVDTLQRQSEAAGEPDRLLVDLAERLYSLGLMVVANVGSKDGMIIPLAIGHPIFPDELLVAVLTDNARFAAEKSLRVRYRHWEEQLEAAGWQVHMVYSAGVFVDPQREASLIVEKVLDIVEARVPNLREEVETVVAQQAAVAADVEQPAAELLSQAGAVETADAVTDTDTATVIDATSEIATVTESDASAATAQADAIVAEAQNEAREETQNEASTAEQASAQTTKEASADTAAAVDLDNPVITGGVGAEAEAEPVQTPADQDEVATALFGGPIQVSTNTAESGESAAAKPAAIAATDGASADTGEADTGEADTVQADGAPAGADVTADGEAAQSHSEAATMVAVADEEIGLGEYLGEGAAPGATIVRRPPKPRIAMGMPLAAYSDDQLDDMLAWVRSDGTVRTEAEEVEQLRQALSIVKRGAQVSAVLTNVVRRNSATE